jgi:hypothetical protein
MKKIFVMIAILAGIAIVMSGCTQAPGSNTGTDPSTTDSYTMNNLPSKFSTEIPDSLKTPTSSGSLRAIVGQPSTACTTLRGMTSAMKSLSGMAGLYAIIADAAITANPTKFPSPTEQTVNVTITKEMVAAINSVAGDSGDMTPYIGIAFQIKLTYTNNNAGTYPNKAIVSITDDDNTTQTTTIEWSTDKTKSRLSMDMGQDGAISFTYDSAKDQTTLSLKMIGMSYTISMVKSGNGILLYMKVDSGTTPITVKGFADDNGGYVAYVAGAFSYYETFDAQGLVATANATYTNTVDGNTETISLLETASTSQ